MRTVLVTGCFLAASAMYGQNVSGQGAPKFITFDAPGAADTYPTCINTAAVIAGTADFQSFVRSTDGTITVFGYPLSGVYSTSATAINVAGTITGIYVGVSNTDQGEAYIGYGFVRAADGTITSFSAPGAGSGANPDHQGTFPTSINNSGRIAGYYTDANGVSHGFVRTPDGTFTSFDPSGSAGTFAESLNARGVIAGYYVDAVSGTNHGFVRDADRTITAFDPPGAGGEGHGTFAWGINDPGAVTGSFSNSSGRSYGFVRDADGAITTFSKPGSAQQGTFAVSIDDGGKATGYYYDAQESIHGFTRGAGGAIRTFAVPGAGTGGGYGTRPAAISNPGEITGYYSDANGVSHGFVLE